MTLAAALAAALMSLAACTGAPAPPPLRGGPGVVVDGRSVYATALLPMSGAQASIGRAVAAGLRSYIDALDANGGMGGWYLNLTVVDTGSDPRREQREYRQWLPESAFIAASMGGPAAGAIEPAALTGRVLVATVSQDSRFMRQPVNLLVGPPYRIEAEDALAYLSANGADPRRRVAIAYLPDGYGSDSLQGYRRAVAAYHLTDVAEVAATGAPGLLVRRLQASRAAYVLLATDPARTAGIVAAAARTGYRPRWILENPAWSVYQITPSGLAGGPVTSLGSELTGAWEVGYDAPWGDVTVPWMNRLLQQVSEYAPGQVVNQYVVYGYCLGAVAQALVNTAVSGGDLSRAGFLRAKARLGDVDFGGLAPPAHYGPGGAVTTRLSDISRIEPGAPGFLAPLTPFFEGTAAAAAGLG